LFTTSIFVVRFFLNSKLYDEQKKQRTLPKSCKFEIKILADPGLTEPGLEQPGPAFYERKAYLRHLNLIPARRPTLVGFFFLDLKILACSHSKK